MKSSVLVHVLAFLTRYVDQLNLAHRRLHSITHLRVLDVTASVESITTASMITVLVVTALMTLSSNSHLASTPTITAHIIPSTTENFIEALIFRALTLIGD